MIRLVPAVCVALLALLALSACGITPAPDFRGRWKPVNDLAAEPRAIPLQPAQRFAVLASDRTLKETVERWGRESRRAVVYRAPTNYSLHLPASRISASNLESAVHLLEQAYSAQNIQIALPDGQILVTGGLTPVSALDRRDTP